MPRAVLPVTGDPRICIIHKNIPEMLAKITTAVSASNTNIENMVNSGRKDYAYTILDVASVSDTLEDALKAIDGIIRVRIIK